MIELPGTVGFASPISQKSFAKRRRAGVEFFATLALAISLVVAATAVFRVIQRDVRVLQQLF